MTCKCNGTKVVYVAVEQVRWAHACRGDERRCAFACPVEEQDIDYEAQPCECAKPESGVEVEG